jgi:hypothetical protein
VLRAVARLAVACALYIAKGTDWRFLTELKRELKG